MIFNSIRYTSDFYVNEAELEEILEYAPDRFKYETMAEATAKVIGEQEINWGRLMVGVGMSELTDITEGVGFVNEEGRIRGFFEKIIAYLKMAINKLGEITKSFIVKLEQFIRSNAAFIKKYEKTIKLATDKDLEDLSFNGYEKFNDSVLDTKPTYDQLSTTFESTDADKAKTYITAHENDDHALEARKKMPGCSSLRDSADFDETVTTYLYGDTDKTSFDITKSRLSQDMKNVKDSKDLKKKAKESYTKAAKAIQTMIGKLEKAETKVDKDFADLEKDDQTAIAKAYNLQAELYREYAQACTSYHGTFMRALSTRARQSKAICTKVVQAVYKRQGKAKRNDYRRNAGMDIKEGYIDSDAFLGAVEFI